MERNHVGRGAIYLYIQLISSMISGYIFLIILARITTTEIIGTFSLLVSISEIFANISLIGLPDSIQKFVGKSFLQSNRQDAKTFARSSFMLLAIGILASCMVILSLRDWLSNVFGISFGLIIILNLLIASYAIYIVLYSIVVATLKTKILPIVITISSVGKVVLALAAVSMGYGVMGLTLGYTFFGQILSSILLGIFVFGVFKSTGKFTKPVLSTINASKNLLIGGLSVWIPALITILGIDLGTLVLYNTYGSHDSGVYFIALAITNAVNAIVFSLFTVTLPVLSSMDNGRKRFVWQTIRIAAIMALPLSTSIIFYSNEVMSLFGHNYEKGSLSLQSLLLSTFPIILLSGIETLVFSYGRYRDTLIINLASSIPRTVLYFALVPIFGMSGVAISFTIGSLLGVTAAIIVANRIRMKIFWRPLILTFLIPLSMSYLFATLNVNYVIGIVTTLIITYLLLMRTHTIVKSDGSFLIQLMPDKISISLVRFFSKIQKIIDWFYS